MWQYLPSNRLFGQFAPKITATFDAKRHKPIRFCLSAHTGTSLHFIQVCSCKLLIHLAPVWNDYGNASELIRVYKSGLKPMSDLAYSDNWKMAFKGKKEQKVCLCVLSIMGAVFTTCLPYSWNVFFQGLHEPIKYWLCPSFFLKLWSELCGVCINACWQRIPSLNTWVTIIWIIKWI